MEYCLPVAVREWKNAENTETLLKKKALQIGLNEKELVTSHRHMSHMFPIYPLCEVTMDNDPETIESCLDVLDLKPGETAVITGEDQTAADFTPLPGNDTEDHFFGVKRVRRF